MRLSLILMASLSLSACSGAVREVRPLPSADGSRQFQVYTVFGLVDGDRAGAEQVLGREAEHACGGGFEVVQSDAIARTTIWGAENGQVDLFWQVRCLE